jgi:hypothetical protein
LLIVILDQPLLFLLFELPQDVHSDLVVVLRVYLVRVTLHGFVASVELADIFLRLFGWVLQKKLLTLIVDIVVPLSAGATGAPAAILFIWVLVERGLQAGAINAP